MRRRMLGLMMAVGLLMGAMAAPAAAQGQAADPDSQGKGCPYIGVEWSMWAKDGGENFPLIGEWTSDTAVTGSVPDGYETFLEDTYGIEDATIEEGPGVYSRVLAIYCDEVAEAAQ